MISICKSVQLRSICAIKRNRKQREEKKNPEGVEIEQNIEIDISNFAGLCEIGES